MATAASDRAGVAGFAALAGRFVAGRFATGCFTADFFVTARFGVLFFAAAFFGAFAADCFLAVRLTVFFFAAFLAFFGARAFVVAFAPVFLRLLIFLAPAFLLRALVATTRRCLRGFTRAFFTVFFLAGATTNSL
ncbi:hypothetical protein [Nitrobacter sp. 62-13]|uniref:hypothetical protein n=1 Tax=Nitrobacter sp. 62-13 TaxID=1895797 RepID=UPI0025F443CC|nr:hypothetical protein [Nitrobacter sp. 62-13]